MKRTCKIFKIVLYGILLLLVAGNQALALGDTWTTKAPMPVPLGGVAAAAIDGKLYVAGGRDVSGTAVNILQVYDPATDAWTIKAPMPTALSESAAEVINGILYVIGGTSGTREDPSLQAYNPATDTWTTLAPMPGGRYQGDGAGVINGQLYIPGGWTVSPGLPNNNLFVYNPSTNSWSSKANMPTLSACGASGVINGKFYVITPCNGYSGFRNFLHVYDPVTDIWTSLAPSPNVHAYAASGVIGGKFYVAGGADSSGATTAVLDVYDQATDTWTSKAQMSAPRSSTAAVVINGELYVAGGSSGSTVLGTLEVYTPTTVQPTIQATIPTVQATTVKPTVESTTVPSTVQATTVKPTVQAKFRVGPSVTLRPVTDVIEADQDGIVELFMNNPSLNDVVLNVDASISVPSGFHVSGQGFSQAAGAGTVYGTFNVPPGNARTITVTIKADKSARIGSHTLQFSGLYYPGDNKDNYQPISLTYSINVKEPSEEPGFPPTTVTSTPKIQIPGFGVVLAIISIFMIAGLLSRKLSK